jgi:hypothetical protein
MRGKKHETMDNRVTIVSIIGIYDWIASKTKWGICNNARNPYVAFHGVSAPPHTACACGFGYGR